MTFAALVKAYIADLYRYGFWLCRNQAQAEDLVQETFMRAWKGLDGLKDSKAAKAWLFTILRREHARHYSQPSLDLVSMDEMDFESQHFAAPGSDGAADIEFTQALDALPLGYREPLLLQALAASVVLTVGLITGMLAVNYSYSLEDVALAHVRDEPMALQVEGNIQLSQLNTMLAPYNLKLQQAIGRVRFAMPCRIRQHAGAHLVMQGEYGNVTVLIMPGEYVTARKTLQEQDLQGLLIPTDGGSIAIIGQAQESFEAIEARISQALIRTV